jgi:hypothetical protein
MGDLGCTVTMNFTRDGNYLFIKKITVAAKMINYYYDYFFIKSNQDLLLL